VSIDSVFSAIRSLALALLVALTGSLVTATTVGATRSDAAGLPRCRDTQIAITGTQLPGAAVSGGWVLRYRNVSSSACTLSGYPVVVGVVSATGKSEMAKRARSGALGGWEQRHPGAPKPLPIVVLRARTGVASSVVEFVAGATAQSSCPNDSRPLWFHALWVNVPGGTRPFVLKVSMVVCSHFDANPIVPGATGSAN